MNGLTAPRLLAALALVTVVLGRGLAQGLVGVVSGLDLELSQMLNAGAHLSQFTALVFLALATRLTVALIVTQAAPAAFLVLAAATCGAVTLVGFWSALSSDGRVSVISTSISASLVLIATGTSAVLALKDKERRGVSLLCLAFVAAGALHLSARWLALNASESADASLYFAARLLATGGAAAELLGVGALFFWLLLPSPLWLRAATLTGIVCVPALALYAERSSTWALALRSTLEQLSAHPDPLFPAWLGRSTELWALLAVVTAIATLRRPGFLCFVAAMAALSRSSADVPVFAIFFLSAALALQLPQFGPDSGKQPSY